MILGDGQTDFGISLEPSIFVHEDNIWRFKRIFIRKKYLSMVKAFMKLCILGPLNGKMPGIEIIGKWTSCKIG